MYVLLILSILVIIGLILYNKFSREALLNQKYLEHKLEKEKEIEQELAEEKKNKVNKMQQELEEIQKTNNSIIANLEKNAETLRNSISEMNKQREEIIKNEKKRIDSELNEYKEKIEIITNQKIENDYKFLLEEVEENLFRFIQKTMISSSEAAERLTKTFAELEEYEKKRAAANEALLRERELAEKKDFYRVCLSEDDKNDMELIRSLITKINNRSALNKLIWEVYAKKNVAILCKNVLENREFSGIYKFTHIKTGQVYIGKSTNLKKRMQEHYKSAFDLSTIASSAFHIALKKYGIDEFTYEVLEECSKEQLTEREKYWIGFYESDKYGFNERRG